MVTIKSNSHCRLCKKEFSNLERVLTQKGEYHIACYYKKCGDTIIKDEVQRINILMPTTLVKSVKRYSKEHDVTMSRLVRMLIEDHISVSAC